MRFRKKPTEVEAVQFTGHNWSDLARFNPTHWYRDHDVAKVHTRHGTVTAEPGDWIIRGEHGDLWPCKPDIFETTYEAVE